MTRNLQTIKLPNKLNRFDCWFCDSLKLNYLPNSIEELAIIYSKLNILPSLPARLKNLNCYNNLLTKLPNLPDSLEYLDLQSHSYLRVEKHKRQLLPFFYLNR